MVRRRSYRRTFLKGAGATVTLGSVAGCTGGGDGGDGSSGDGGDGGDGSGGDGGDGGGGSTTTMTEVDVTQLEGEEWRSEVSARAAEELSGGETVNWYTSTQTDSLIELVANGPGGSYSGVYEPLNAGFEVVKGTGSGLEARYARELAADASAVDIIDVNPIDLISAGVPFGDLTHIPAFKAAPDNVVVPPYIGAQYLYAYGPWYNTNLVDTPPESYDDLLGDAYSGSQALAMDFTPPTTSFLGIVDITGEDWWPQIKDRTSWYESVLTGPLNMGKGQHMATPMGCSCHLVPEAGLIPSADFPIAPVENPHSFSWANKPISMGATPAHPHAAMLAVDFMMSSEDVQTARPGTTTLDGSAANPSRIARLRDPEDPLYTAKTFQEKYDDPVNEVVDRILRSAGAPRP